MNKSELEETLYSQMMLAGLSEPARQFRFHKPRRWTFDFSWPGLMLAVEVQGGTWVNGGHSRGAQQKSDFEKLNAAQLSGWVVLQFDTNHVTNGEALNVIEEALRMLNR